MDRARRDFRVSIAEVDDQDLWNCATLGAAAVSNDATHAESIIQKLIDLADADDDVVVESALKEVIRS